MTSVIETFIYMTFVIVTFNHMTSVVYVFNYDLCNRNFQLFDLCNKKNSQWLCVPFQRRETLLFHASCTNLLIPLDNSHLTFLNSFSWCRNEIVITPSGVIKPVVYGDSSVIICGGGAGSVRMRGWIWRHRKWRR